MNMDSPENTPAAVIRERIAIRGRSMKLNTMQIAEGQQAGVDLWEELARSIELCVGRGVAKLHELKART